MVHDAQHLPKVLSDLLLVLVLLVWLLIGLFICSLSPLVHILVVLLDAFVLVLWLRGRVGQDLGLRTLCRLALSRAAGG